MGWFSAYGSSTPPPGVGGKGFFGAFPPPVTPPSGGQFVAVGSDNSAGSSTTPFLSIRNSSGVWTPHDLTTSVFAGNGLFSVAYALSQWLAGSDFGNNPAVIGTSPDALTWSSHTNPDPFRHLLACGGDAAFANFTGDGQTVTRSSTGTSWTDTPTLFAGSYVAAASAAGGGNYVVVGLGSSSNNTGHSGNGSTWALSGFSTNGNFGVIWDGAQFVQVCENLSSQRILATSPDGLTWTPTAALTFTGAQWIAWNGARYVLVGGSSSATATTVAGLVSAASAAIPGATFGLNAIAAGGGTFVTVGFNNEAFSSTDGATWTTENPGLTGAQLNAIAFH